MKPTNAQRFFTHPLGLMIAAVGATFFWGSAFPAIKRSYELLEIFPDETSEQWIFAGYRFVMAAFILLLFSVLVRRKGWPLKQPGFLWSAVKVGTFQTLIQYLVFYIGLSYSSGVQGSIIAGTTSFFQMLFARMMYRNEPLSWQKGAGLIVGFAGVWWVTSANGAGLWVIGFGEALLLLAMMSGAFGNLLSRNESTRWDILSITAWQMLLGGILLTFFGASGVGFVPFDFDWNSLFVLIYLAFCSAAGFGLWNSVMRYNPVGKVSMYMFLVPVFGVMLSNLWLREAVTATVFGALALVVTGIIIVNRDKQYRAKKQSVPH
jgi:drug/metabolite transporter (DMT)-like permease